MKRLPILIVVLVVVIARHPSAQTNPPLEKLFASAQHKATVAGDLKGAIEDYKRIVATAGQDRAATARALLRMAEAYQKLGDGEGQQIYRRIVNDFADQKEVFAVAVARLRSDGAPTAKRSDDGPVNRSAWTPPDTLDIHGKISADGRLIPYRDLSQKTWTDGGLFVRDVTTGSSRRLVALPDASEYPEGSSFSRDSRQIAYAWRVRNRGIYQLRVTPVEAAASPAVRVLLDNADIEWLAPYDWTPDGKWIAVVVRRADRTAAIGLVSSQDGSWRQLQSVEWNAVFNVAIAPGGDYLAFDRRIEETGRRDVFVMTLDGSRSSAVAASAGDDMLVGWSPDGRGLFFVSDRSGTSGLWSVAVARGGATGPPSLLYPNVGPFWPLGVTTGGAIWSVVMATAGAQVQSSLLSADMVVPSGTQTLDDFAGPTTTLRWSHQGGQLAWASQWLGMRPMTPVADELQRLRLNVRTADGETRRLHPPLAYINDFAWAADDRSLIVAGADHSSRTGIFRVDAQTSQATALVLTPGEQVDLPPNGADGPRGNGRSGGITANHLYYRRIRIDCPPGAPVGCARQTSKLVEHDLRTGAERDVLSWAGRFWRGRPDRAGANDVVAITSDQVLYMTSHTASDALSLNVVSLDDGADRELFRTAVADTLVLLGVTEDTREALVRRDVAGSTESEVWLIAVDGVRPPERLNVPSDISAYRPIGWSSDRSRLLLARPLEDEKSELATLTLGGEFKKQPINKDLFWTTISPDGLRLAHGTAFRAPAAPLGVWVLERAINGQK
jgi:WD40 repeat protein